MSGAAGGVLHVLVVHFNTPRLIAELAKDIPSRTPRGRKVSVHVLDNCSTPDNARLLRAQIGGMPRMTIEFSDRNVGFGAGMNKLASRADIKPTDIVWLLNPDTQLQPGCLDQLEDELDSGEFSIVSPLIYSGYGADSWIWYCGGTVDPHDLRVQHKQWAHPLSQAPTESFETEFVSGAAPMMHASTFHAVGEFPRDYFLYWEDAYFSWKARAQGLRLGVVPRARLWHAAGASSGHGQTRTFYYWFARNRFAYASDIGVPRRRLISGRGGFETLRPLIRALREPEDRIQKVNAAVRGTVDGLRQHR